MLRGPYIVLITRTGICRPFFQEFHQEEQKIITFHTYTWESTMGIGKTLQSNGELYITRANNILNLKILKHKKEKKGISQWSQTTSVEWKTTDNFQSGCCTLNLAGKPSFWIILAYWKERKFNKFSRIKCEGHASTKWREQQKHPPPPLV